MKSLTLMCLVIAALLAPVASEAQIRTGGEPQRTGEPPKRVSPEPERVGERPQRVGERPQRVGVEPEPMGADHVVLAVSADSPLAGALRESFESGQPLAGTLIGLGIGAKLATDNDDAALAEELKLVVGPVGAAGKYYVIRLTHARVADIRPDAEIAEGAEAGEVAMEEFVLAYEGFELEPIAGPELPEGIVVSTERGEGDVILVDPDLASVLSPLAAEAAPAGAALPDLSIQASESDPAIADVVRLRVVNSGTAPSAATRVRLWVMPEGKAWYAVVPALAAGEEAWVRVQADSALRAADRVFARVDDPDRVPESDERNNGHVVR